MTEDKRCSLDDLRALAESRSLAGIPVEGRDAFRIVWYDAPLHMADALDRIEEVLDRVTTLEELEPIKRAHRGMFWPTMVLYFLGMITAPLLRLFFLLLEMGVAYVAARWVDPSVQSHLSFEVSFVVLFLLGDLLLSPVQDRVRNALYWALFRRRMAVLESMLSDVEEAIAGVGEG